MISEGVHDLVVQEREQLASRVDEVRLDPEVAEDRRVLAADDAGAVDGDGVGHEAELQDRVAVENARVGEVNVRRVVGARAHGQDEGVGDVLIAGPLAMLDLDHMVADEVGGPVHDVDVVALVEAAADGHLAADDRLGPARAAGT